MTAVLAILALGGLLAGGQTPVAAQQPGFSSASLTERLPVEKVEAYTVNVKIRPLLLFWIGRDDVGEATITWRQATETHKSYEFIIGSDPKRAPRQINRWGFVVEELHGDNAEVLGIMKESGEQTLAEAEAKVASEGSVSTYKAARTTIDGGRAVSGVITMQAPSGLTYRDLDSLLALLPAEAPERKTLTLPAGTQKGFLVALESLMASSFGPCLPPDGRGHKAVPAVRYLYNQTLFDLSLESCRFDDAYHTGSASYSDIVDGRFKLRNLTTKNVTTFHLAYGTAGELRGVPVRAMFRPRWWMEIELERARPSAARLTSIDPVRR